MKNTNKSTGVFILMAILVIAPFAYAGSAFKENIKLKTNDSVQQTIVEENVIKDKVLIANLNTKFTLPLYQSAYIDDYNNLKVYFGKILQSKACESYVDQASKCFNGESIVVLTLSMPGKDGQTSTSTELYLHQGEELGAFGLRFYLLSYDSANHAATLLVTKVPINYVVTQPTDLITVPTDLVEPTVITDSTIVIEEPTTDPIVVETNPTAETLVAPTVIGEAQPVTDLSEMPPKKYSY